MSAEVIGKVRSSSNGKTYDVKWNSINKETYVSYAGWSYVGKANTISDALTLSSNWLSSNS